MSMTILPGLAGSEVPVGIRRGLEREPGDIDEGSQAAGLYESRDLVECAAVALAPYRSRTRPASTFTRNSA
jgi:hypothetical protein